MEVAPSFTTALCIGYLSVIVVVAAFGLVISRLITHFDSKQAKSDALVSELTDKLMARSLMEYEQAKNYPALEAERQKARAAQAKIAVPEDLRPLTGL